MTRTICPLGEPCLNLGNCLVCFRYHKDILGLGIAEIEYLRAGLAEAERKLAEHEAVYQYNDADIDILNVYLAEAEQRTEATETALRTIKADLAAARELIEAAESQPWRYEHMTAVRARARAFLERTTPTPEEAKVAT